MKFERAVKLMETDNDLSQFTLRFNALPKGYFTARYIGRRYGVTKSRNDDGRQGNLVARELGGNDYISLNIYQLSSGAKLKPCEMPEKKVIDFVMGLEVEQDQA